MLYEFCESVIDSNLALELNNTQRHITNCKASQATITLTEIGEQSKQTTNKIIRVSSIASTASSNLYKCRFLINVARWAKCRTVLELGTNLGVAASALSESGYDLTTIEGNGSLADIATAELKQYSNTKVICSSFDTYLDNCTDTYDMIIIDGDHSYEATIALVKRCSALLNPEGIILIDDIRWSDGMKRAWSKIKSQSEYNLCLDIFMMGIVSHKEQLKSKVSIQLIPRRYKPWPYHFFRTS